MATDYLSYKNVSVLIFYAKNKGHGLLDTKNIIDLFDVK